MAKEWAKRFYNSGEWKKMRQNILARDRYRCQAPGCFSIAEEVHHKIELNEQNVNDKSISLNPNNLISLCSDCHKKITRQQKDPKQSILPDLLFDANGQPFAH